MGIERKWKGRWCLIDNSRWLWQFQVNYIFPQRARLVGDDGWEMPKQKQFVAFNYDEII